MLHPLNVLGRPLQVTVRPMLGPLSCLSCLYITLVIVTKRLDGSKMPLDAEIGLSPGDIVLDRDPAPQHEGNPALPHEKGHKSPLPTFRPMSNGWMHDQYTTLIGTEVDLCSGDIVFGTQFPHGKGHSSPPPHFSAYCSATVAHLSNWGAFVFQRRGACMDSTWTSRQSVRLLLSDEWRGTSRY